MQRVAFLHKLTSALKPKQFLPSATKLRRLCFYTCLSVHRVGVCLSACWDTPYPWSRHPPPQEQAPPRSRQPPRSRHPPGADTPSRRLLLRTVRILLECILVRNRVFLWLPMNRYEEQFRVKEFRSIAVLQNKNSWILTIINARKPSWRGLCIYTCLSFCPQGGGGGIPACIVAGLQRGGGWYPSMPCRFPGPHPGGSPGPYLGEAHTQGGVCIPACTEADSPQWLLLRAVCILLECILVIILV